MTRRFRSRAKDPADRAESERIHQGAFEHVPGSGQRLARMNANVCIRFPRRIWFLWRPPALSDYSFRDYILESDRGETITYGDLFA